MDQTSTVPSSFLLVARLKNLIASAAVVALALGFHRLSAFNRKFLEELYGSTTFSFTGEQFLATRRSPTRWCLRCFFFHRA